MAGQQQTVSGVPGRYARALFELAQETGAIDQTARELDRFAAMLEDSEDLRRLVKSPVFRATEQIGALNAVLEGAGISGLAANFILLAARNRRARHIPAMIQAYRALIALSRGEVTAQIISAEELSEKQIAILKEELAASIGQNVLLVTEIDSELIGGLILKIGSRMVDDSLRTKLQNLKMVMKGIG